MTYQDAKEFLKIAENAYQLSEYQKAADIAYDVAHFIAYDKDLPKSQHDDIVESVKRLISSFQFCPDECCWEDVCGLMDLFRAS